ncbi:MAG TPA: glycosyltransferase family 39 protein, partial [Burkholderiales bacterium]|nr:glycosyltransferase family 39 protein [Burkholderiales bacterium]
MTSSQYAPASPGSEFDLTRLRHWFFAAVAAMLALRLAFAAVVPLTSDEAYYASWALHPAFGYFDHPPMVAWWLTPLAAVSTEPWVLRLPAVLVPSVVSLTVTGLLREHGQARAYLAGLALTLVPVEALYVPITTDTPLIFFTVLSVAAFAIAVRRDSTRHYLLAGALLGCAFLSKYFAALLGFAYLVFALVSPPRERRLRGVLLAFLAAVPFVALNLW